MGNIGFVNLRDFALTLKEKLNINTFIETGTFKAETSLWASDNFNQVYSIEAYYPLHERAKKISEHKTNLTFIFGDSGEQLEKLLNQITEQSIIWLDAHWCGGAKIEDLGTTKECPIKEELAAIKAHNHNHIIMIDDAKFFTGIPPYPHTMQQWPRIDEIKKMLPAQYQIVIWNDAIICAHSKIMPIIKQLIGITDTMQIVVLTSNDYLRCLPPFAHLFNKFWGENQSVTVVRYDIRPPKLPVNFNNVAIGKQQDYTWSSGLISYLNYADDLIILMLEDYFIDKPVKVDKIKAAYKMMKQNETIVKFDLTEDRLKFPHIQIGNGLIKSNQDAQFLTSTQAAIWQKDFLLSCLHPSENAWQFEKKGTKRLIESGFDKLILGYQDAPLSYINAVSGEGSKAGQFDFKRMPKWMIDELGAKKLL
jgi:hypothetical protein